MYVTAYAVYYMIFVAHMELLAGEIVYLLYALYSGYCVCLFCGMISYTASHLFVNKIYDQIRAE